MDAGVPSAYLSTAATDAFGPTPRKGHLAIIPGRGAKSRKNSACARSIPNGWLVFLGWISAVAHRVPGAGRYSDLDPAVPKLAEELPCVEQIHRFDAPGTDRAAG
jgi:hypothetical protein